MRFYFTYIFGNAGTIIRIGEDQYYNRKIEKTLERFISRRFEGVALQYFHRMAVEGKIADIEDFGSYWYDDPETKTNGEFDCVIKRSGDFYDFFECKYFDRPMTFKECEQEKHQLMNMKGIEVSRIGFVCTGGFEKEDEREGFVFIDGDGLYKK